MEVENRYVAVRHHVEGSPSEEDFEVKAATVRWTPGSGEVLVRNLYVSVDPYQLNRMKRHSASHHSVEVIVPGEAKDIGVRSRQGGGVGVRGVQGRRCGRRRARMGRLHHVPGVPHHAHRQGRRRLLRLPLVLPHRRARNQRDDGLRRVLRGVQAAARGEGVPVGGVGLRRQPRRPVRQARRLLRRRLRRHPSQGRPAEGQAGVRRRLQLQRGARPQGRAQEAFPRRDRHLLRERRRRDAGGRAGQHERLRQGRRLRRHRRVRRPGPACRARPAGGDLQAHHPQRLLHLRFPDQVSGVRRDHRRSDHRGQDTGGRRHIRRPGQRPVGFHCTVPWRKCWQETCEIGIVMWRV